MDSTINNISNNKKSPKEADIFDYGKSQAKKLGIKKSDINRLIKETRNEAKNSA